MSKLPPFSNPRLNQAERDNSFLCFLIIFTLYPIFTFQHEHYIAHIDFRPKKAYKIFTNSHIRTHNHQQQANMKTSMEIK